MKSENVEIARFSRKTNGKLERYLVAEGAVFDAQAVTDAVSEGIAKIENASSMEELKAIKTQYAGADSAMTQASKAIGALPKDQKKDRKSVV